AWTLVRFVDSGMLQLTPCTRCGGHFVAHAHVPHHGYVCGLCQPPSRAGPPRKAAAQGDPAASAAWAAAPAGPASARSS
ncbi:FlhC family transcriptional regulator, partial [Burkholderia pseudomallei]